MQANEPNCEQNAIVSKRKYSSMQSKALGRGYTVQLVNIITIDNGQWRSIPGEGGTLTLGYTGNLQPEWLCFQDQKYADGCKLPPESLWMGHDFNT